MIHISERPTYFFKRDERLRSRKDIDQLFREGTSLYQFPFKVVSMVISEKNEPSTVLLVTVSKKNFKKATDRNHIKRMIREGWRLQKQPLDACMLEQQKQLQIALIYTARNILDSNTIHHKIKVIIQRFQLQYAIHP